jgi:hypothetical protein
MKLNGRQRTIILLTALVVAGMVVYPPWQSQEGRYWASYVYSWIFVPPSDPGARMSAAELGALAKEKLPGQYDDLSDAELGRRIRSKVPNYSKLLGLYGTDVRIDAVRLGFQCIAVILLSGAILYVLHGRHTTESNDRRNEGSHETATSGSSNRGNAPKSRRLKAKREDPLR